MEQTKEEFIKSSQGSCTIGKFYFDKENVRDVTKSAIFAELFEF